MWMIRPSGSVFVSSGHRGSPFRGSFTEAHILAITQAICDYRKTQGTNGPLYTGKDTHALSGPAQVTALEVLAANEVQTVIQRDDGFTPTPVVSHAILVHNRSRRDRLAWFTTARAGIDSPTALSSPPHTTVPVTRLTTPPAFDEPML